MTTIPRPSALPAPLFDVDEFADVLTRDVPDRPAAELVHLLVDYDHLSHVGPDHRVVDGGLLTDLDALATAVGRAGRLRTRGACSTLTALTHWPVLTGLPNNSWQVRAGLDGADQLLEEELAHLGNRASTRQIVLVSGDHAHARTVARLGAAGVPVWVIARPGSLSNRLRSACHGYRFLPYQGVTQPVPSPVAANAVAAAVPAGS